MTIIEAAHLNIAISHNKFFILGYYIYSMCMHGVSLVTTRKEVITIHDVLTQKLVILKNESIICIREKFKQNFHLKVVIRQS